MRMLYVIAYLAIEIGVFVALAHVLGLGLAVLVTVAAVIAGSVILRSQGRKVFADLRRAVRNEVEPRGPLTDTALLAASTLLLVIPGIVSTVVGLVLLAPPVRRALRPAVVAMGSRRFAATLDRAGLFAGRRFVGGTVVDGAVVDTDAASPGWPHTGATHRTLPRGH